MQQEKKFELLVGQRAGSNYDRINVGEVLCCKRALLCTPQYFPAHQPKMSEVVRMLEDDGLAKKWVDSHDLSPQLNPSTVPIPDDDKVNSGFQKRF